VATRRSVLQSIALSGGSASLGALGRVIPADKARPNILWLVSEDHSPFIGAYGDKIAHTPFIDALAKKGILFRNAYANAPVCAPSRFGILTGCYPESCGPAHHMRATAKLPEKLRTYPEYLRSAGYYCVKNDKTDYNCDVNPDRIWNESGKAAHWRNRPEGAPFMSVFNYMTTHESRLFKPTPTLGPVRPDQVRIPAYLPDTPKMRTDFASYYNLIAQMDAQIGERLADLEADGLAEDTIVFYYSDHGGALPRSKRYCYDEGLRAALVTYIPPKWQHLSPVPMGTEVTAPVSLIDLAPTLLSLVDIPRPDQMSGAAFLGPHAGRKSRFAFGMRNRMDERYDFVRTATDGRYRYIRNYMPHRPWGMRGDFEWIAKGYQSWDEERLANRLNEVQARFFGPKPFEEFYDLETDPDQIDNLVGNAAQSSRIAEFRKALDTHILVIRDNGFIPEGEIAEGYWESRNEATYPLRFIMNLAKMAAKGELRNLKRFSALMKHKNPVVRYWAVTGILILRPANLPEQKQLAALAEGDSSPAVRVAAAEALCRVGLVQDGLNILAASLKLENSVPQRLMALNALDALGEIARPALPAIKSVVDDQNEYIVRAAGYLVAVLEGTYRPDMTFGRARNAG
jgi:arylsulfatase A-like enzyme